MNILWKLVDGSGGKGVMAVICVAAGIGIMWLSCDIALTCGIGAVAAFYVLFGLAGMIAILWFLVIYLLD